MRARATVGEVSDALEKVFTRHEADIKSVSGVYGETYGDGDGIAAVRAEIEDYKQREGQSAAPPRGEDGAGRS